MTRSPIELFWTAKKKINFKAANACSDLLKFSGEIDIAKKGIKGAYFWLSLISRVVCMIAGLASV